MSRLWPGATRTSIPGGDIDIAIEQMQNTVINQRFTVIHGAIAYGVSGMLFAGVFEFATLGCVSAALPSKGWDDVALAVFNGIAAAMIRSVEMRVDDEVERFRIESVAR